MLPRLSITFDTLNDSGFVIEELTVNPYVRQQLSGADLEADVWIEFSIRRSTENIAKVPDLMLRFSKESDFTAPPTTNIPERISGSQSYNDMNFVMYSDIWYSFVRIDGDDYEFMNYGYKCPIRVVQYPLPKEISTSVTGGYEVFRKGKLKSETDLLRRRVNYFNRVSPTFDLKRWKTGTMLEESVYIPVDEEAFSSVSFQFPPTTLRGKFAVRRKPWDGESGGFGLGYGGSTDVEKVSTKSFKLIPKMFDVKTSKKVDAYLDKGELIRFWVMFSSKKCMSIMKGMTRVTFSYQIEVDPKLESFNSFLRIPAGYDAVPGTVSGYKHYAVPPRLFFLWDKYLPEQCLGFTESPKSPHPIFELSAAFKDENTENQKLVNLFIFAFLASVLTNLWAGDIINTDLVKSLKIKWTAVTSILILLIASGFVYRNKQVNARKVIYIASYVLLLGFFASYGKAAVFLYLLFGILVILRSKWTNSFIEQLVPQRLKLFISYVNYLKKGN